MFLLDTPPEIFASIISYYVQVEGVNGAWKSRDVCGVFAYYIEREVLEKEPFAAFLVSKSTRPMNSIVRDPCTLIPELLLQLDEDQHGQLQANNLTRFLFSRLKFARDVHPSVIDAITRNADLLAATELRTSDKWLDIAEKLCRTTANYATITGKSELTFPFDSLSIGNIDIVIEGHPRKSYNTDDEEAQRANRLVAASIVGDRDSIVEVVKPGCLNSSTSNIFGHPIIAVALLGQQKGTLSFLVGLLPQSVDAPMRLIIRTAINESLRRRLIDEAVILLNWYNENVTFLYQIHYTLWLSNAIESNDPRAVDAVFRTQTKKKLSISWQLYCLAIKKGNLDLFRLLLDRGEYDVNQSFQDTSPLDAAVRSGNIVFVQELLDRGARPNGPDQMTSTLPLISALEDVDKEIRDMSGMIRVLLDAGAVPAGGFRPDQLLWLMAMARKRLDEKTITREAYARLSRAAAKKT